MSSCCKILDLTVLPNLYKEMDFLVSESVGLAKSREVSPEVQDALLTDSEKLKKYQDVKHKMTEQL
jgi:hypothetical protein